MTAFLERREPVMVVREQHPRCAAQAGPQPCDPAAAAGVRRDLPGRTRLGGQYGLGGRRARGRLARRRAAPFPHPRGPVHGGRRVRRRGALKALRELPTPPDTDGGRRGRWSTSTPGRSSAPPSSSGSPPRTSSNCARASRHWRHGRPRDPPHGGGAAERGRVRARAYARPSRACSTWPAASASPTS